MVQHSLRALCSSDSPIFTAIVPSEVLMLGLVSPPGSGTPGIEGLGLSHRSNVDAIAKSVPSVEDYRT